MHEWKVIKMDGPAMESENTPFKRVVDRQWEKEQFETMKSCPCFVRSLSSQLYPLQQHVLSQLSLHDPS